MKKMACFGSIVCMSALIGVLESGAQTWTNLSSGMEHYVEALAFDSSGNLYAGGEFTNAGDVAVNRIAKWDGTTWTNLVGDRAGGNVYELAFDSAGNLYAAGGTAIEKWNGTTWTNISAGIDWFVYALACDNAGNLYAGGSFTTIGGVTVNNVAKWNGTTWSSLGSGMDYYVYALICDSAGNLYAGGSFTNAGGVAANRIAKWNGTTWTNLGSGIHSYDPTHDAVLALALDRSENLYVGGDFSTAGNVDGAYAVAKWNGTTWAKVGDGLDRTVNALACDSAGNLYAGGEFDNTTGAGAIPVNRVAKWNGIAWSSLGSGLNNSASVTVCDGANNLYVGGAFTTAGGITVNHIAKWYVSPTHIGPVIKANEQIDNVIIKNSDNLSITIQLDPGQNVGVPCDWWVVARAGSSSWIYMDSSAQWQTEGAWRPMYQGGLFNLPAAQVWGYSLPVGSYTFYFILAYPMDGLLDGALWYNSVNVTVK